MKKIGFIMAAFCALAIAACNYGNGEDEATRSWKVTEEFIGAHGNFDAEAIPSELLKIGMIRRADEWLYQSGKLYEYMGDMDGRSALEIIFFEDGTCWECFYFPYGDRRGHIYHVYTWSYDPKTAVITTSYIGDDADAQPHYRNMKAQVKAFDGTSMIIDGNLCGSANIFGYVGEGGNEDGYGHYPYFGIYTRLLMKPASAKDLQWWLDNGVKANDMNLFGR